MSGIHLKCILNFITVTAASVMELILLALSVALRTRISDSRDKYGTSDQPEHTKFHRWDA